MGLVHACKSEGLVQGNNVQNAIKKCDSSAGPGLGLDLKIEAMWQTQWANFNAPDNENMSKQQSNNTQCTAGYLAKRLINLIQFYWSYPCFR